MGAAARARAAACRSSLNHGRAEANRNAGVGIEILARRPENGFVTGSSANMPEYLAPGVYIEEASFRSRRIEGVDTATAGFVGPTRRGPSGVSPAALTSVAEFESVYGSAGELVFADRPPAVNYVAHAVRQFFANGGKKLYVAQRSGQNFASNAWSG